MSNWIHDLDEQLCFIAINLDTGTLQLKSHMGWTTSSETSFAVLRQYGSSGRTLVREYVHALVCLPLHIAAMHVHHAVLLLWCDFHLRELLKVSPDLLLAN